MKFIIGLIVGAVLAGGTVAANLPNADNGECVWYNVAFDRSDPTYMDPDGVITGGLVSQVCGYQVPNSSGHLIATDDLFWTEIDAEQADAIIQASKDIALTGDNVYLGG